MNGGQSIERRQWQDVYFMYLHDKCTREEVVTKGTLFVTENESKTVIHWVPDPDQDEFIPEMYRTGCEINVSDLDRLFYRAVPGFNYRGICFYLKSKVSLGPFEFRAGGSKEFLTILTYSVDIESSPMDPTQYHVKPLSPISSYRLPQNCAPAARASLIPNHWHASLKSVSQAVKKTILSDTYASGTQIPSGQGISEYSLLEDMQRLTASRLRTTEESGLTIIVKRPDPISLPEPPHVTRGTSLTLDIWTKNLDSEGRVTCLDKLRSIIFYGGVENELRPVVWKYLLGYYRWEYTAYENERVRIEKHQEYHIMKAFWKSMSPDRQARFSLFRGRKCCIDKDVPRTDRKLLFYSNDLQGNLTRLSDVLITYTMYNMDFGYFQGMNDLLALILYVMRGEEDAFWCFVGLMNRLESNFHDNINSLIGQFNQISALLDVFDSDFSTHLEMKNAKDIPFCFRWLLIHFKREFSYSDTMILWEAIWSDHLTKNFHIFFATAVLIMERNTIMQRNYDSSGILKHVNDLSGNIPLETALNKATGYIHVLDSVLNSLPDKVRDIIHGPSLASSRHLKSDFSKSKDDFELLTDSDEDEDDVDYYHSIPYDTSFEHCRKNLHCVALQLDRSNTVSTNTSVMVPVSNPSVTNSVHTNE